MATRYTQDSNLFVSGGFNKIVNFVAEFDRDQKTGDIQLNFKNFEVKNQPEFNKLVAQVGSAFGGSRHLTGRELVLNWFAQLIYDDLGVTAPTASVREFQQRPGSFIRDRNKDGAAQPQHRGRGLWGRNRSA